MPAAFDPAASRTTLFAALLAAAGKHGARKDILEDPERQPLTYGRLILGAMVIGAELAKTTRRAETVGVLLPNVNGLPVVIMGLNAFGRVPALLNFSAGIKNLRSAIQTGVISRIITSRRFITMGNLQPVIDELSKLEIKPGQTARRRLSRGHPQWHRPQGKDRGRVPRKICRRRASPSRTRSGPTRCRAVHLRHRRRTKGCDPDQRQSGRERRPDLGACRRAAVGRRYRGQPVADLPLLWPHSRHADAAVQRHESGALPEPAALQGNPEADRRDQGDRPFRDRHVPARLCARRGRR